MDKIFMKNKKKLGFFRHKIQILATFITNANIHGYTSGRIYKGNLKNVCVPGLNCYSCVGALGSCPIGSLQAVIGKSGNSFSFYVTGFLLVIGALLGRFVCGFLCPFGLFQDILHKIPFSKKLGKLPKEKILIKLKYLILLIFVIILPMFLVNDIGNSYPYFCKFICPVGTLEGGVPLVLLNKAMRVSIGFLFIWKNIILFLMIILSIIIYRPFCKFICPLGTIYSLFNNISFLKYAINYDKCINCGKCSNVCMMNINPVKDVNHLECIRCGNCIKSCPKGAIEILLASKKLKKEKLGIYP